MFIYTLHDVVGIALIGLILLCVAVIFTAHYINKAKRAVKNKLNKLFGVKS